MKVHLKVNGEAREAEVEPRTQLAALLRDKLHLTGTHLSCEQGVCGACTILVDGKPIRSCIAYAASYDGATVETIEGFGDDAIMTSLRRAFSEHHALQCGFCTPGMIVAARDIVLRLSEPDEKRIRHELSGNLCRCTGYVGIVQAVASVIRERGTVAPGPAEAVTRAPLKPFALREEAPAVAAAAQGKVTIRDGWTEVSRAATLNHPVEAVAALFADLPRVAACLPGASIASMEGDSFRGAVAIRFGPISAAFEGKGARRLDADRLGGAIDAEGGDSNGQTSARGSLSYRLAAAPQGTALDLAMRFQLKGLLAQFNRADLVEGFADLMLSRFLEACDATLSGREAKPAREIGAFALAFALLRRRVAKWWGR